MAEKCPKLRIVAFDQGEIPGSGTTGLEALPILTVFGGKDRQFSNAGGRFSNTRMAAFRASRSSSSRPPEEQAEPRSGNGEEDEPVGKEENPEIIGEIAEGLRGRFVV